MMIMVQLYHDHNAIIYIAYDCNMIYYNYTTVISLYVVIVVQQHVYCIHT